MKLHLLRWQLPLAHAFTISRESMNFQRSLIVGLEHDGHIGYGEVTENLYYGHALADIETAVRRAETWLPYPTAVDPAELWPQLLEAVGGDTFAASAIDMAAHDWFGKKQGRPTWQVWGLSWNESVTSSFTIGIDPLPHMIAKLEEQPDWPIYKIKLGTDRDLEIVAALRQRTSAKFRVDANGAWSALQTVRNSNSLRDLDVEFIEQPLSPTSSDDEKRWVYENSALPILADEDCLVPADVARCVGLYHGINVKICKCGGLTPALQMLRQARQLKLRTMVGCMVESSIGISGAAQLLPLLDYADLDGAVLLADQPAAGVVVAPGRVTETQHPGTGARLLDDRLADFELR